LKRDFANFMKCFKTTFLLYSLAMLLLLLGPTSRISAEINLYTDEQDVQRICHNKFYGYTVISQFQGSEELIMKDHKKIQIKDFLTESKNLITRNRSFCYKIVVISSQHGVGKSFISLNLASSLARNGQKVLLMDANIKYPGLHKLLYSTNEYPATQCLPGDKDALRDAIITVEHEFDFLGNLEIPVKARDFQNEFADYVDMLLGISFAYDFLIVDTHTGLNEMNLALFQETDAGLIISTPDVRTVFDTYTLIKASTPFLSRPSLYLVINQVFEKKLSEETHQDLSFAFRHFLGSDVRLLGMIPSEDSLGIAGKHQKPVWQLSHKMRVRQKFEEMAEIMIGSQNRKIYTCLTGFGQG
jgi:flagellar biosynthesis protein FlhG